MSIIVRMVIFTLMVTVVIFIGVVIGKIDTKIEDSSWGIVIMKMVVGLAILAALGLFFRWILDYFKIPI